jgi:hypothetical protein
MKAYTNLARDPSLRGFIGWTRVLVLNFPSSISYDTRTTAGRALILGKDLFLTQEISE